MNINQKFLDNGFMYFENVLSANEVSEIRVHLLDFFKKHKKNHMFTKEFLSLEEVSKVPFLQSVHDKVTEAIGSYKLIPFYSLTYNLHSPVWHRDSQSLLNSTQFIYDKEFQISKCGIYLQDDTVTWGGGWKLFLNLTNLDFWVTSFHFHFQREEKQRHRSFNCWHRNFRMISFRRRYDLKLRLEISLFFMEIYFTEHLNRQPD